jgi:tetratricopeptide (TPR) repeat protein
VDVLNDELLKEMRLAGCERLSLGVESGSPTILEKINKKITLQKIEEAATMAKRHGVKVRFYMMLGNRGETLETFQQTLDFLERTKPHSYIFSCLSIYPGTIDFQDAERAGFVERRVYFEERFQELKVPFDASEECTARMNEWFFQHHGVQTMYRESVADCLSILERLGDHHAAHVDLAGAYYRDQHWDLALQHLDRAEQLGYPLPGLIDNYRACIAYERGDIEKMKGLFLHAAKTDPQHAVLIENVQNVRRWFADGGPERGLPLKLVAHNDFQLFEKTRQPALPGPLEPGFERWNDAEGALDAGSPAIVRHLKLIN